MAQEDPGHPWTPLDTPGRGIPELPAFLLRTSSTPNFVPPPTSSFNLQRNHCVVNSDGAAISAHRRGDAVVGWWRMEEEECVSEGQFRLKRKQGLSGESASMLFFASSEAHFQQLYRLQQQRRRV